MLYTCNIILLCGFCSICFVLHVAGLKKLSLRLKQQSISLKNLMAWGFSPLNGLCWLVGWFMRRVEKKENVLHSYSLAWKHNREVDDGAFCTACFTPICQCYLSSDCSPKILISSTRNNKDFFPSVSGEGGGRSHRILIFFSASSMISNSLSGEQLRSN